MYNPRCEDKYGEISKAVDELKKKTHLDKPAIIAKLLKFALEHKLEIFKHYQE